MRSTCPTREQLIELAKTDPEAIADLVIMLWEKVEKLEARIAVLESNSRNSSKPPSSDKGNFTNPPKPNPKSLRKKSGLKPGGQKGHKGSTLNQVEKPDRVIDHRISQGASCPKCAAALKVGDLEKALDKDACETRQVFELPPIKIETIEHRAEKCACPNCGEKVVASFPPEVKAPVQYGTNLQATALYLGGYQLIPYQRLGELFRDLFNCRISGGTLANFVKRGGKKAQQTSEHIRQALKQEPVIHLDETGCRQHGKRHWLHVACTGKLTFYHIDERRGKQAMLNMGILEGYTGKAVHDFWQSYYYFKLCEHYLCNAHLLRELEYVAEDLQQDWARKMFDVLIEAKNLRDRENARAPASRRVIGEQSELRINLLYCEAILEGYGVNPEPKRKPGQRGRVAQGKALNLLHRLEVRIEEILSFFTDGSVPFDNNQAERDIRMMKTREKISGTFRSEENALAFCSLRSVISTARKQSYRIIDALAQVVHSPENLGKLLVNSS